MGWGRMVAQDLAEAEQAAGRFDAFISYRRIPADSAFVDGLQQELAARGKRAWVDRMKIEPASDWAKRIDRAIDASKALIFVLTPESVASAQCMRELALAAGQHKLIVPVLLRAVDRTGLPESLTRPNWIYFSPGHNAGTGLDQIVSALDDDLPWRDAHTRLSVRAKEWADAGRDSGFVLRGGDLRAAEEWLGQAAAHAKTPPTGEQNAYILASRKIATRTQRTWQVALSAGLALSLALAAVALVQRNQAQTQARLANSRAFAAEAIEDLSSNPSQSLKLALDATKINPGTQAEQALRLAMAQDRLRMVIKSGTGAATQAAWNPAIPQIAVTAPHGAIALWNSDTGRATQVLPTASADPVARLEYDASGSRLAAISAEGYVSIWTIAPNGAADPVPTGGLNDRIKALTIGGLSANYAFTDGLTWSGGDLIVYGNGLTNLLRYVVASGTTSAVFPGSLRNGVEKVASTPDGLSALVGDEIVRGRTWRTLSPQPDSPSGPACWFPDGSAVVTSTRVIAGGPERIYSAATGQQVATMQTPAAPTTVVTCSASPANEWVAAGDERGNVILRTATGTVLPLYGHNAGISAIASSPDGRYLATSSGDGSTRIWDASSGQLVSVLAGGGAGNGVQFGPDDSLALTVDSTGLVQVWDSGVGRPAAVLQAPATGQAYPLQFSASGQSVAGVAVTTSTRPDSRVSSAAFVTWNAHSGQLVRSIALPGIAPAPVPCSQGLADLDPNAVAIGSQCDIPPPSRLVLPVPVPRPNDAYPTITFTESLPVAVSQDGSYVAYARSKSVSVLSPQGHQIAALPVRSAATGIAFIGASNEVLVMTETAIYLWWPLSRRPATVIPQPSSPIDATLSASGTELAVADVVGTVETWNASKRTLTHTFTLAYCRSKSGNDARCYAAPTPVRVALSLDGREVAAGDGYGTVFLWSTVTGRQLARQEVSSWPLLGLAATAGGLLLAADWPTTSAGFDAIGTASVLDFGTGRVIASYQSPQPNPPPINPGAALSPDGLYLFSGALGLAPAPPGGTVAVYQVAGGQMMASLRAVRVPHVTADPEFPAQPWSPDGTELVIGNSIYRCDACLPLAQLQAAAAARIAWSAPLSAGSDHPPAASPYA
jgi:WD40 repeat protein